LPLRATVCGPSLRAWSISSEKRALALATVQVGFGFGAVLMAASRGDPVDWSSERRLATAARV
jgi:hypothetical protein